MRISGLERFLGVIGYLAIFFLVPVNFKRDSMFCQFHGRQSGVLLGLWAASAFVIFLLLLFINVDVIQTILITMLFIVSGLYVIFMLIGMLKVMVGERWRMPVVADVALLLRL